MSTTRLLTRTSVPATVIVGLVLGLLAAQKAPAASIALPTGQTLDLKEDLVLSGTDTLLVQGTAASPCTIIGHGFQIKTRGAWTGKIQMTYATIKDVGKASTLDNGRLAPIVHAIELTASGNAEVAIEHCTFDASNSVSIVNNGQSTATFRANTVLGNSLTRADKDAQFSTGFFHVSGNSPAKKYFQGNRIYQSGCFFSNSSNWVIGGDTDPQGNIFIGMRIGIFTNGCRDFIIKRNYFHVLMPVTAQRDYWSQISTLSPCGETSENVIRSGHWVVRFVNGDFHHNLITEVHGHDLLQAGAAKVHHNIFVHRHPEVARFGDKVLYGAHARIYQVYPTDALEFYNNTLDGRDATGEFVGQAIDIQTGSVMPSLRNNVFLNFSRAVGPSWNEKRADPPPARLGYADYNLFFNSRGQADNYGYGVAGKKERADDGFARHDVPVGGKVDEQVDPRFRGPLPQKFPFSDEDVKAGKVTVSQILKFYRDAYTPMEGSPLLRSGDPSDGAGTDIGAVQVSPMQVPTSQPAKR